MLQVERTRFTVGVFQDTTWAARGIDALRRKGFEPGDLTLVARDTPEAGALVEKTFGTPGDKLELPRIGTLVGRGSMLVALGGEGGELGRLGLAPSMKLIGFQAHDGRIFEALTARGGVLVAVHGEPRAADALAVLHSYGGGNAAIGAWSGRV